MNIQRYLLPATVAATLHVALMLGFPREPGPLVTPIIKVLPEPPPRKKPEDKIVTPPEDKPDVSTPVRPLAGGPTPPELDPTQVVPRPGPITVPIEERPAKKVKNSDLIPPILVPGDDGPPGPGNWTGIFSRGDLDRVPRATVQPPPDYPPAMRQAGVSGSVIVEFNVNPAGRVIRAECVRCTRREFAEPAVRAVMKWHFEPGRHHGQAVSFCMAVPIQFGLGAD